MSHLLVGSTSRHPEAFAVLYPLWLMKLMVRARLARFLPGIQSLSEGCTDFLHHYSDRALAWPDPRLHGTAVAVDDPDAVDLTLGSPRFDLVPSSTTKLAADRRGWPPPWGLAELQHQVAKRVHDEQGFVVRPADEVLITAGISGAFNLALDTFLNPGDGLVLFDPASPLYRLMARPRGVRIRWIPTWMEHGRTRFKLDCLARVLRGAKMLVLNSPANPTGGVLSPDDLEQIAWWANRRDVILFDDRAYEKYHYEAAAPPIGTLPYGRRRTLTAGSVSQEFALAASRVGWLIGGRHLIRPCARISSIQAAPVPTVCQQLALAALRQGPEKFQPIKQEFESRRQYAFERLRSLGLEPAWPAGGYYLWIPVAKLGMSGTDFAYRLRTERKVLVSSGEIYGPSGTFHVRISYAAEDGRLREGLSRVGDFVMGKRATGQTKSQMAA